MAPNEHADGPIAVRMAAVSRPKSVAARTHAGILQEGSWNARTPARPERSDAKPLGGGNRLALA